MNIQKAEVKLAVAQYWGKRIEDMKDAAQRDVHRLEGSATALKEAAGALDKHRAYYQKGVDEGEITVEECKFAMQVINRCVGGLQNLLDKTQLAMSMKKGELVGYTRSGDLIEKEYHKEKDNLEAIQRAIEAGDKVDLDMRPQTDAVSDIQKRRAEAQLKKFVNAAEEELTKEPEKEVIEEKEPEKEVIEEKEPEEEPEEEPEKEEEAIEEVEEEPLEDATIPSPAPILSKMPPMPKAPPSPWKIEARKAIESMKGDDEPPPKDGKKSRKRKWKNRRKSG